MTIEAITQWCISASKLGLLCLSRIYIADISIFHIIRDTLKEILDHTFESQTMAIKCLAATGPSNKMVRDTPIISQQWCKDNQNKHLNLLHQITSKKSSGSSIQGCVGKL